MDDSRFHQKKLLLIFVATGIVFFLCLSFYGSFYEEYQGLFNSFLSQAFSPGTLFNSWYYQGYIGISFLYARLYQQFPGVEWVSWLSFLYMFAAACGFGYCIIKALGKQAGNKILTATLLLFLFILLADNILHFQNARVAYLLCGSALLLSIIHFREPSAIRENRIGFIAVNALYLLGCLSRSEPGLGMLFLFVPFSMLWHQSLRKAILPVFVPLLISSALFLFILADLKLSDEFHKQVEPDVEMQLTVRNNIVPLGNMKTAVDSMKYEAAKNMLWGDPRVLDEKFLRSLIADAPYLSVSMKQINRTLQYCFEYVQEYAHLIFFSFLFLFLAFLNLYKNKSALQSVFPLCYFLVFLLAIFVQSYYVKMRDWSFSPYAALFLTSCALYYFKTVGYHKFYKAGFFLLLLTSVFHVQFVHANSASRKQIFAYNSALYASVKEIAGNETLLLNPSSYQSFLSANRPFEVFDYSDFSKLFFYESQIASVLPGYREYLMKECSCDVFDFSQFYNYLLDETYPHKVFALSTHRRMDLIQRYLQGIHSFRLEYHEVPDAQLPQHPKPDEEPLRLYVLTKAKE